MPRLRGLTLLWGLLLVTAAIKFYSSNLYRLISLTITFNFVDNVQADLYIYAATVAMTYGVKNSNRQRSGGPNLGP